METLNAKPNTTCASCGFRSNFVRLDPSQIILSVLRGLQQGWLDAEDARFGKKKDAVLDYQSQAPAALRCHYRRPLPLLPVERSGETPYVRYAESSNVFPTRIKPRGPIREPQDAGGLFQALVGIEKGQMKPSRSGRVLYFLLDPVRSAWRAEFATYIVPR